MKKIIFLSLLLVSAFAGMAQNNAIKGYINKGTERVTVFDEQGHLVTGNKGPAGDPIIVRQISVSVKEGEIVRTETVTVKEGEAALTEKMRTLVEGAKGVYYIEQLKGVNQFGKEVALPPLTCNP